MGATAPEALMATLWSQLGGITFALGVVACANSPGRQTESAGMTVANPSAKATGWHSLFDGQTQNGWRVYKSSSQSRSWSVRDGALVKTGHADDIITTDQFSDFELELEWKLAPGGNAGIFYRGTEEYEKIYWSAPEYQLLDDAAHRDGGNRLTSAGAAYALYPAPAGVVKPANQWNSTRLVVRGPHVEHWLNGTKLLEYELWSPDWEARVKASKFVEWPNYGRAKRGHIAIQGDHEGELSLRNIRIRELTR
jgi:hypothetical protein